MGPRLGPEPLLHAARRAEPGEVAVVDDPLGRLDRAVDGGPGEAAADADPLRAGPGELAECQAQPAEGEHVDGLGDRFGDGLDLLGGDQRGRIEDVGARPLERLQARDRVVEVGIASQVVLGAGRESEGEAEPARRLGRGGDPLGGRLEPIERAAVAAMAAAAEQMRDRGDFSALAVSVPLEDWLGR